MFRGHLFALLIWVFSKVANDNGRSRLVVACAAAAFAAVHLAQPGVRWLQLGCIASTGTLYGRILSSLGINGVGSSFVCRLQLGAECDIRSRKDMLIWSSAQELTPTHHTIRIRYVLA